jgi:hypothetical protein
MPKSEIVNPDPFCEVRLENIEHGGRKTDKFLITLQDPETEQFREIPGVGTVHSVDYTLVTNRQVHDTALKVMHDTGMAFKPIPAFGVGHSSPIYWNGRRFSEKWFCEDTSVAVPGGSAMMMGMEITNSYDGSAMVGLAFFAMHVACSNQFYSCNLMGEPFAFPHVNRGGKLDDDIGIAMQQIQAQARDFAKIAPNMKALQKAHVKSFDDFLGMRKQLAAETGVEIRDKQLLDELSGQGITAELKMKDVRYEDPSSLWCVANAYTAVTTHCVGGPRGSDHAARVTDWLLKRSVAVGA